MEPDENQQHYCGQFNVLHRKWFSSSIFIGCMLLVLFLLCLLYGTGNLHNNKNRTVTTASTYLSQYQNEDSLVQNNISNKEIKNINMNRSKRKEINYNYNDEFMKHINNIINCNHHDYKPEILLIGNFWILKNFVLAEHGRLNCYETITYTTHADYSQLDHLISIIKRWHAPISVAIHAPGTDFFLAYDTIYYLRLCSEEAFLIQKYVTFHIYFNIQHMPSTINNNVEYNNSICESKQPPYIYNKKSNSYKIKKKILYPSNVGRNIARQAALTHYILSSNIEFYPSGNLIENFFNMIINKPTLVNPNFPRVFTLPIFILNDNILLEVIKEKEQLIKFIKLMKIIPYNKQSQPKIDEWLNNRDYLNFDIFKTIKRNIFYKNWDPIYIGTNNDPYYDERLKKDVGNDKSTQIYALCLLDYDLSILNNAFMITTANSLVNSSNDDNLKVFAKNLAVNINLDMNNIYGKRFGCF